MAVARCEQALHNLIMEASWSLEAGALFMAEEFDSHSLGFDEFEVREKRPYWLFYFIFPSPSVFLLEFSKPISLYNDNPGIRI